MDKLCFSGRVKNNNGSALHFYSPLANAPSRLAPWLQHGVTGIWGLVWFAMSRRLYTPTAPESQSWCRRAVLRPISKTNFHEERVEAVQIETRQLSSVLLGSKDRQVEPQDLRRRRAKRESCPYVFGEGKAPGP